MNNRFIRKYAPMFLGVLAWTWFISVYHHNLPDLNGAAFRNIFLKWAHLGLVDVLLVLWIWLVAYLIGRRFLAWLRLGLGPGIERVVLSTAAGLAFLSLVVLALAAAKIFYRPVGYAVLLVPTAWQFSELRRIAAETARRTFRIGLGVGSLQRMVPVLIYAYLASVLGIVLLSALGPEIEYDSLVYHLTGPKFMVQRHGLKPLPDIPFSFFPKNIEMLFTLAMRLNDEIAAKLTHYLLGLLTILSVYAFACRFLSRNVGLLAVAVLASSPLFLWEMRTAHIDLGLTFYVFLSLYAVIVWLKSGEKAWFALAACFLAFSLGIKYHALFALAAVAALVFLHRLVFFREPLQGARVSLKLLSLSLAGLLPWAVVNLAYTGNPLFPLFNNIFRSPYWTEWHTRLEVHELMGAGARLTGWDSLLVFWKMVGSTDKFHGNIGPFFFILLPLLAFKRGIQIEVKVLLIFAGIYSLIWLATGQVARFLLPVLPGLALAASYGAVNWFEIWQGKRVFAWATAALVSVLFVLNTPFFEEYGVHNRYGSKIMETLPLDYLLGKESKEDYLTRNVRNYAVIRYLNGIPGRKKVFFCWNDTEPSTFYVDGESAYLYSPFAPRLSRENPEDLGNFLRQSGVTHLIVGQHNQGAHLLTSPEQEFVQRHLRRLCQRNATILYELASEPVLQDTVYFDFLIHIQEAKIRMTDEFPSRPNSEYRYLWSLGRDQRHALLTHPPAEVRFSLTLCERPTLRFAIGQAFPHCTGKGVFQVWVVGPDGTGRMLYIRELDARNKPSEADWLEEEFDLAAYARQPVEIVFKTVSRGGECNWYFWADPVIVNRARPPVQDLGERFPLTSSRTSAGSNATP